MPDTSDIGFNLSFICKNIVTILPSHTA